MSGMRTFDVSQRRYDSKEKKIWFELDLRSQPRNWAEFIHKLIGRHWVGPRRSEESCDRVIGVAEVLSGVREGLLGSWSDKSYPAF